MCFHIPFLIIEGFVVYRTYQAWYAVQSKEDDGIDDTSISKMQNRHIYNYFDWWIRLYGVLYCLFVIRRIYSILLWTFKDPRSSKTRVKLLSMVLLNTSEIGLGIAGIIFKIEVKKFIEKK